MAHGLVRPSVIPPRAPREVRALTRSRTSGVRARAPRVNRVHQARERAHRKRAAVATASMGVSGRAIRAALLAGETDPGVLAALAKGPLRKQRPHLAQALRGHLPPHQRCVLPELLAPIDRVEERSARCTAQMEAPCAHDAQEAQVVALRDGIPGLSAATAQVVVAAIGTAMPRFPAAAARAAWAGLAPGNTERAGRHRSGRTRTGTGWLRTILVQAAHAAAHTQHPALAARSRRRAARRGQKQAVVALAHARLVISYHVSARRQPYHALGADDFQRRDPVARAKRLVRQLTHLGCDVQLPAQQISAPMPDALPLPAAS